MSKTNCTETFSHPGYANNADVEQGIARLCESLMKKNEDLLSANQILAKRNLDLSNRLQDLERETVVLRAAVKKHREKRIRQCH